MSVDVRLDSPPARTPARRRPWWLLALAVLTLGLLVYMLWAYVPPDIATSRADMHGDQVRYALLVGHIGFGTVATVTGLLQLWPRLRARHPRLHRWTGRTYFFLGIFPAAILAIPVTLLAEQGVSNQAALLVSTGLWLATGIAGLRAACEHRYRDHRAWMIRNFAITLSLSTSRLWGGPLALIVFSMEDSRVYQGDLTAMIHDMASAGAWLSLTANLLIAQACIQGHSRRPRTSRAPVGR